MLERANRHLGEMQAELQRQREEAERNRLQRDIGIGLMFIPLLGTIAGEWLVLFVPYCLVAPYRRHFAVATRDLGLGEAVHPLAR